MDSSPDYPILIDLVTAMMYLAVFVIAVIFFGLVAYGLYKLGSWLYYRY